MSHYLYTSHWPHARLPQPTAFDKTVPSFHEWVLTQETCNFVSVNKYNFAQNLDFALLADFEVSLGDVTATTELGEAKTIDVQGYYWGH